MRKKLAFFILFLISFFLEGAIVTPSGAPTEELLCVLKEFNISHDGRWETIVEKTQKLWKRSAEKERWEVEEYLDPHPKQTYELFCHVGMLDERKATTCCYDYALVLGATVEKVRSRLFFLKQEWERGVRFKKLVFLTGDRPLTAQESKTLYDSPYPMRPFKPRGAPPKNETEMMTVVFDQMVLPQAWDSMTVVVVDTPQREGKRPNTEDTFRHWLTSNPHPGTTLIVSDQPFLGRADALAHKILPPNFTIETVGAGVTYSTFVDNKRAVPILLDELARWIYTHLTHL